MSNALAEKRGTPLGVPGVDDPLVSVIVSAYNRPAMLRTAIASVVEQSYQNLEILVQDDSTTGECEAVVANFSDPRVVYTRNKPSLGTALNLRAGYEKSKGIYFCTLNDDDYYHPDYIASMVHGMRSDERFAVSFCDQFLIDEDGALVLEETENYSRTFHRDCLTEGPVDDPLVAGLLHKSVPAMFALFRRSAIDFDDFPIEVSSGYDYWLTYLAIRNGAWMHYNPRRLTYYRIHQGSQTSTFSDPRERLRMLEYAEFMHSRMLSDRRLAVIHPELHKRLAELRCSRGFALLRLQDPKSARREFFHAIGSSMWPRSIAGILVTLFPAYVGPRVVGWLAAKPSLSLARPASR